MRSLQSLTISSSSWTTTTLLMPGRSTMPSPFCSITCRHGCTSSSPPARIHSHPWPGHPPRPPWARRAARPGAPTPPPPPRRRPRPPRAGGRARGQLGELRGADLRFTPSEAAKFLEGVMGLSLSEEDIAALETRTAGWIAGLQLAALSMRGREDVAGFIRAFAGDNRYVVDYLVEEVLQRQPEPIRGFLLQTSILDRLSGPLCDAVTGQEDGRGMLEAVERGNLFVVPLDDERRWYRYHHLFAGGPQGRLVQGAE